MSDQSERAASQTGSREPSRDGSALAGFDPSRDTANLPVPRCQLRWAPATVAERRKHWCLVPGEGGWACHYELILPLVKGDIRRRDSRGRLNETLVIPMGKTVVSGDELRGHAPFRDATHSRLDAAALGGLPVYLITGLGEAILQPASGVAARQGQDAQQLGASPESPAHEAGTPERMRP